MLWSDIDFDANVIRSACRSAADGLPQDRDTDSDASLIRLDTNVDAWKVYNTQRTLQGFADQLPLGQHCYYVAHLRPGIVSLHARKGLNQHQLDVS
jgi:hypothetical protein